MIIHSIYFILYFLICHLLITWKGGCPFCNIRFHSIRTFDKSPDDRYPKVGSSDHRDKIKTFPKYIIIDSTSKKSLLFQCLTSSKLLYFLILLLAFCVRFNYRRYSNTLLANLYLWRIIMQFHLRLFLNSIFDLVTYLIVNISSSILHIYSLEFKK